MQTINSQVCPICRNRVQSFFQDSDDLLECKGCGIVVDKRSSLNKTFYENERTHHVEDEKIQSRKRNVKQRAKLLKKILKRETSLLDMGCGEGLFLEEVKNEVGVIKGIEPTIFYANYAKEKLNLDVQQGGIEDIDFSPVSFDIITMFHVLEHLNAPNSALKRIYPWLKPGGHLVIEVPNIKSPTARFKGLHWELITPEHRFHFSPDSLKYLLEKQNFELISIGTRDFDQYRIGIGKSLRKLGISIGTPKSKKSIKEGGKVSNRSLKSRNSLTRRMRRTMQLPLKAFLGWLVMMTKRGDYLFVVARKV